MNTESVFAIVFVCVMVGVLVYAMLRNNRDRKKYLETYLKNQWGKFSDREYSSIEMACIKRYADKIAAGRFSIDDITWNDLNMDQIFQTMNQTASSTGEDYLYAVLRVPEFSDDVLAERERLITYFSDHGDKRVELQHVLCDIGKIKDMSIGDYIFKMKDAKRRSITKYVILALLSICSILSLFIVPAAGVAFFVAMTVINIFTHHRDSEEMEPYFRCFACILRILKAAKDLEKVETPELADYKTAIRDAAKPLMPLRKRVRMFANANAYDDWITTIMSYINSFFLLDFIAFYLSVGLFDKHEKELETLVDSFGVLDAMIAVASYREALAFWCAPKLTESEQAVLTVKDIYHPMIGEPVANSIEASGGILLTGSNASGKSTFLKCIAVNAIFAQSIHTCAAHTYEGSYMKVMTSMSLRDDLARQESYYIVEIKSIRRIIEEGTKGVPLLCMVDEVLRGTNTIERIAASSSILYSLHREHVLSFAATHDIELTFILEDCYKNYHFEEEIRENDVAFSYILMKGRASTRNAIALLKMCGYSQQITDSSNRAAKYFEEHGVWEKINIRTEKERQI